MGAVLDHRPGVVTKGFCALPHEQEQQERDSWQLDQPEEDELSCDLFVGFSEGISASQDLPHSTSSARNKSSETDNGSQSETPHGERCRAQEAPQGKDGHVADPLSISRPSSASSPLPSALEMNGHVALKELQALHGTAMDRTPGEGALALHPFNPGALRSGEGPGLAEALTGHPSAPL